MERSEDYQNGYRAGRNNEPTFKHQTALNRLNDRRRKDWMRGYMDGLRSAR